MYSVSKRHIHTFLCWQKREDTLNNVEYKAVSIPINSSTIKIKIKPKNKSKATTLSIKNKIGYPMDSTISITSDFSSTLSSFIDFKTDQNKSLRRPNFTLV